MLKQMLEAFFYWHLQSSQDELMLTFMPENLTFSVNFAAIKPGFELAVPVVSSLPQYKYVY